MANLGPTQTQPFLDIPVFNSTFPQEGPKIIPYVANFSVQQVFNIDLSQLQQTGYMKSVQGLFFDNSLNTSPVTLTVNQSNQSIKLPGNSQGYIPLFVPNPPKFTVTCTGGNPVQLYFTNLPMPATVWSASGSFLFTAGGLLEVSDVALDASIVSNKVNVTMYGNGNNNVLKPFFVGDEIFTGAASTTTAQTIVTGSPSYFVTDIMIALSGDAALASAGPLTLTLKDSATTIAQGRVLLPAASPTASTPPLVAIELNNIQYNSKTSAVALTITASANLTAGEFFWNIAGGLCGQVGP